MNKKHINKEYIMDKKVKKFFASSVVSMIVVCIVVFTSLTIFMAKKTEKTVINVSSIYMSEMNVQLKQKFTSVINLRLEQTEGVIRRTPPELAVYGEQMLEALTISGEVRNFLFLGLLAEDGEIETIYGKNMILSENPDTMISLESEGDIVTQGIDEDGNKILILGKTAEYPMKDGGKSVALIAGISMEYLNEALFLNSDDAMLYSHIIDWDGSFVVRNADAYRENYFERMKAEYEELNGKVVEQYINELQAAMHRGEEYYALISINGEERHVYCSPLSENTRWYLITVMPNGILEEVITELDSVRVGTTIGSSVILLLAMSVVFIMYYRLTRQQMEELDRAKQESVRANMAKSEFLSSMSHDIRTPMNAIVGMTDIALKNIKDTMRVEDCLRKVKLSSKHLLGLINDVLDMSKIESGKMSLNITQISLRETMEDIVNIMQPQVKARNQFFDIFIEKIEAENVCCDSVRLNQVLLNILSNAVKFTPEEGSVDIYLYQEASPLGEKYIRTHFRIKDTGIGMSEEFQKKIFESFSRENTEQVQNITGTGLGMAITKYIVDLMGGTIELKSKLKYGSEFHVVLDLERADSQQEEMRLPEWNVLVVDDNEQLCSSAVSNLEELGVHAEWTLDGREAVKMIEEHHDKKDDYHFVLLDWKMPNMDGIDTLREIRKSVGEDIPIFLISAYDWSDIEEKARATGIEGFISKPLFKSTLYLCLKQYMEGNKKEKEEKQQNAVDFTGKHILVVEDIDLNWEIANEILSSVGLIVERATNGKVCVDKFEQSALNFYDAILMDIRMPVMNGFDATKEIRKSERPDKGLPIIAMTADAFSDDVQYCIECGMDAHIAKPIDIRALMILLQKYLV